MNDPAMPAKPWRAKVKRRFMRAIAALDDILDVRWRKLRRKMGYRGVPRIQPYIGYANQHTAWVQGRVLTNPPSGRPSDSETWWTNLTNSYRRFASNEVPGVKVQIDLGGKTHTVATDAEGYFQIAAAHAWGTTNDPLWSQATYRLVDHADVVAEHSAVTNRILLPSSGAHYGVISDVDDTILHTGATRLLTVAKLTLLGNAKTRQPLHGVAKLYRKLQHGLPDASPANANPIFYVSSSPWNLYDLLVDFLDLQQIPLGPLLLRDFGFDREKFLTDGHDHKLEKTRRILTAYSNLPFLLFGDSGQDDADLYATAAEEFPEQVKAIFIRDVDVDLASSRDEQVARHIERASSVGVPMHLVRDSGQAAELLARQGLLDAKQVRAIQDATTADARQPII